MPREDAAQLVHCPCCAGETETTRRRRSMKISVPGFKSSFSPTDGDLVNHHLKHKLMNVPQDYCFIPEHNHYEAEPWDLIPKYNELSDEESKDNLCFFFSNNRSGKRNSRSTPKGFWHETSMPKPIEGSHGVTYVMRYFTFRIGRRKKDEKITPWHMREYTDPSKKGLALCKIFKDVGDPKKKNSVCDSVIAEPSNIVISPGLQTTPEASPDNVMEPSQIPTPLSDANLTSDTLVSPQVQPTQFEESQGPTWLSDLNLMNYGAISPQEQAMHFEEGHPLAQNASDDQLFLDFDNPQHFDQLAYSKNTPNHGYSKEHDNMLYPGNDTSNIGVVLASKRSWAEGTSLEASQQPPTKKPRIPINHSQNLDLPPSNCGYNPQQTQLDWESICSSMNSPFNSNMSFPHRDNIPINYGSEEINKELDWESICSSMNSPFNSNMSFPHRDNIPINYGSEEINTEEASLANPPTEPVNFASSNYEASSKYQFQGPVEGSCKNGYAAVSQPRSTSLVLDNHNILYLSESHHAQETDIEKLVAGLQATISPSNYISLDDIPYSPLPPEISPTNSTNIEGHSDECLSPSNRTYDKVKFYGVEIHEHEAQQTHQQVLPGTLGGQQKDMQQHNTTPQQKDMQFISKDMSFHDIDDNYQCLWN